MDSIVNEILLIEKRAKDMIADAEEKNRQKEEALSEQFLELERDIMSRKSARLKKIIKTEELRMIEETAKTKEQLSEKLSKLQTVFDENKEKWITDITNDILFRLGGRNNS